LKVLTRKIVFNSCLFICKILWTIFHNDELGYEPSSIATFQSLFTNESSKNECLIFKGFRNPTLYLYLIEIKTIQVDCCMLINKMMCYYINKIFKLFWILCKCLFEIFKLNILIIFNYIFGVMKRNVKNHANWLQTFCTRKTCFV